MKRIWGNYSLSITLALLFFPSWFGQLVTQWWWPGWCGSLTAWPTEPEPHLYRSQDHRRGCRSVITVVTGQPAAKAGWIGLVLLGLRMVPRSVGPGDLAW